ncbi:iron complex transport system substrate-binding protein [Kineococcus radiotolerans]|uniref:Iron complex transport system substrate-binding protein n=1 Tax=Kineococcus radiotolerans TaxID=131568 RepID=A0A7W4TN88_KINRA|nr:iron-siderophore ABC transporter substrate-binding protein [Kineococcus radiotolerans]MBB2901972.1 iron complex transport system substrate-binding protein [Kineococcus radiotolerans]
MHVRRGVAAGLVAGVLLAGCSSTGDARTTGGTAGAAGSTAPGETARDAAGTFPRTVEHDRGSTTVPAAPERVVALDDSLVGAVAGLDVQVVGHTGEPAGLPEVFRLPRTEGSTHVGTLAEPNLEAIAALQPDLIVSASVRHEELYDELSAIAPTVFTATTGPAWKDNVRLVARALGREEAGEQQLADYEERAAAVGADINAAAGRPTISLVRFLSAEDPARLYARASFPGIVLRDAGLARPARQDVDEFAVEVSPEQIDAAAGDRVFYSRYDVDDPAAAGRFTGNGLWRALPATTEVSDERWYTSVGVQGAHLILDDLAAAFGVDPHRA